MSTQRGGRGSGAGSSSSHSRKGKSPMSPNTPTVPFQLMDEEVEIPEEWQQEFEAQAARASVGFEDIPEEEEHLPTQESESVRPSQTRTSGSLRSDIFAIHYKRDEQNNKAICNHCGKNYAFVKGGGYGSLNKHLQNCHPDKVGVDTRQTQFPRGGFTGECQGTPLFKYSDPAYRQYLAKMVCGMSFPFNTAENDLFKRTTELGLQPQARNPSRRTLVRDIMNIVGEFKYSLIEMFGSLKQKVSICSDVWSDSFKQYKYMGITCHWIDDNWCVQKRLIAYREFEPPHTAQAISHKIHTILQEYKLTTKIFSISFDNAASNTASLPSLIRICKPTLNGKFFHIRCMCHVLNLCVQDGLDHFKSHVDPIRDAITNIYRHDTLTKKWRRFCKTYGMSAPKRISKDVPTRWNSTYKMLKDSYDVRNELCAFFAQEQIGVHLFPSSWDTCVELMELLKNFKEATEELSGCYYPTSPLVLDHCVKIACMLQPNESSDDLSLQTCIATMRSKWLKYYLEIPELFIIAKLLDPTYREEGCAEMLRLYYETLFCSNLEDSDSITYPNPYEILSNAKKSLYDIYKEYRILLGDSLNVDRNVGGSNLSSEQSGSEQQISYRKLERYRQIQDARKSKVPRNNYQEVDNYLSTTFEELGFNSTNELLRWWSRRAKTFPILALIAKEVFAAPASTVSVEQAFSEGGYILDPRRSNMKVEHLEAQALLHDWSKAEIRKQEENFDDDDPYDNWSDNYSTSTGTDD